MQPSTPIRLHAAVVSYPACARPMCRIDSVPFNTAIQPSDQVRNCIANPDNHG